jgi:hypothetical protein
VKHPHKKTCRRTRISEIKATLGTSLNKDRSCLHDKKYIYKIKN